MLRNSDLGIPESRALVGVFQSTISRVEQIWADHAFQRWDGQQWRKQALAGLYDAQMIACDQISDQQFQRLREIRGKVLQLTRDLFQDAAFEEAVRLGTNTPSRMTYRVSSMLSKMVDLASSQ